MQKFRKSKRTPNRVSRNSGFLLSTSGTSPKTIFCRIRFEDQHKPAAFTAVGFVPVRGGGGRFRWSAEASARGAETQPSTSPWPTRDIHTVRFAKGWQDSQLSNVVSDGWGVAAGGTRPSARRLDAPPAVAWRSLHISTCQPLRVMVAYTEETLGTDRQLAHSRFYHSTFLPFSFACSRNAEPEAGVSLQVSNCAYTHVCLYMQA